MHSTKLSETIHILYISRYSHYSIDMSLWWQSEQSCRQKLLCHQTRLMSVHVQVWLGDSIAECGGGCLVQLLAAVRLVQSALAALHHVNEIGQCLLLIHRNISKVTTDRLCQLGFVEARPGLQLVVSLVAPQRVHLQLEQVHLWHFHIMVRGVPSIVTGLPLSLVANTLDEVLVEVADIKMSHTLVDVQLELFLWYALLDPLTEGSISSWSTAALSVFNQTAALAVERGGWRSIVAVLFRTEPIHDDSC